MSSDKNFNKYFTNNNMMDYLEIDIETNNNTQQQIQSMNSLHQPDCAATGQMKGKPIATQKEWRERRAPFFVERRARRSYQYKTTRNNSLKPEPWRKPES